MTLDEIRESALANFELLLDAHNITWKKLTENEYDIIAPWRKDNNFGGCRFNIEKGRGADFAGTYLSDEDFSSLGEGFTKDDFLGVSSGTQTKIGFDVIGLFQRICNIDTYNNVSKYLHNYIDKISNSEKFVHASRDAHIRRQHIQEAREKRVKEYANDLWESSKYHKFEGSAGAKYLRNRGINKSPQNVRCHPSILYAPTKTSYPALLFKVQSAPDAPLVAVHRIYLEKDGTKAKVDNSKMILGPMKGAGIWFGEPCSWLYITEGPENALSLVDAGVDFCVCTISAVNFHNLVIPEYVTRIILCPDMDNPGLAASDRAKQAYKRRKLIIDEIASTVFPMENGKMPDINDLMSRGING